MSYSKKKTNLPAEGGKTDNGRGVSGGGLKIALGVVICAVVLGGVWWWMTRREPADPGARKPVSAERNTRTKKDKAPQTDPKPPVPPKAETPKPVDPNARPTKVGEVVNGYVMLPSGRIHKPTGVVTNHVANYGKSKYSIFEHRSDNEIAGILMMNPGDAVVGAKRYDQWFTKQFLKSMETPIVASPDDEPWKVDLKKLVIQARLELKEAYDNGEDIDAIMSESRQQLQDLAKYKQAIKQLYAQNIKECKSDDEIGELQRAVNAMLEEKGCAPINFTPLTKLNLRRDKTHE